MYNKLKSKIIDNKYPMLTFIVTFLMGIIIFSIQGRLIGGYLTFVHCDMKNQMIAYITMFLRQLFVDHNLIYSFDFALGGSTIPQYAFYACFNPLNLILLLPVNINVSSFLLVMTKLSLGAYAFCLLCKKNTEKVDCITVLLSVSYALCGFNLAYYHVIIWLDGVYLLPVTVMMIIKLLKEKRESSLILIYALLFIVNFYTGYIVGIYTFIFFVLYLVLIDDNAKTDKIKVFCRYIMYVFLAVLISMVVLLPTAVSLVQNSPEDALGFDETIINIFDMLKQFYIGQAYDEVGYYPYLYCGLIPCVVCPLLYTIKEIKRNIKLFFALITVVLILFAVTEPGYMFIHAFNNPDGFGHRYAYLFVFTLLLMFSICRSYLNDIKSGYYILMCVLMAVFISVYSYVQKKPEYIEQPSNIMYVTLCNVIFLMAYMFIFVYLIRKKYAKVIFSLMIICELLINGFIFRNVYLRPLYEVKEFYDYFYNEEEEIIKEVKEEDDIFRIYMPKAITYNNPQLMGYGGVNAFSSILNGKLNITLRRLGYRSNYLAMSEDGSTPLMRILLGQNYYVYTNDLNTYADPIKPKYEKKDALPIAYMISDDIKGVSLADKTNPFDNQDDLISAMCGEKIDYFYNTGENVDIRPENVYVGDGIYENEEVVGFEITDDNAPKGYIDFVDETYNSGYAYFEMMDSYAYTKSPVLYNDLNEYYLTFNNNALSEPKIMEMKQFNDGSHVYIIMDENTDSKYYFKMAYFYGTNDLELQKAYEKLSAGAMDVEVFKDGYVKGMVSSAEGKDILFTSIPYEEGWDIYIDGIKSSKIALVDNTFLGAEIPYGDHLIEFKYTDKWAVKGGIVSLVGLIFTGVVVYMDTRRKNTKVEAGAVSEEKMCKEETDGGVNDSGQQNEQ